METWEQVFWSASPVFPVSALRPATEYVLTDFRLVIRRHERVVQELALDDVAGVRLRQAWPQRLFGTSSVHVLSRRHNSVLKLSNIRHGPQLALILQLRAAGLAGGVEFIRDALRPDAPPLLRPLHGLAFGATIAFAATFGVIGLARHDPVPPVIYAADDPIAPNGQRRTTAEIVAFMEREVMPWARTARARIAGGADRVSCETCHGGAPDQRGWQMPSVSALPLPDVLDRGWEIYNTTLDAQMRNAIYGYSAGSDNQAKAGYMREIVMPSMARLLHRPAYDFTRTYDYNRSRRALGCYHCHRVK